MQQPGPLYVQWNIRRILQKKFGRWAFIEFQSDVFQGKASLQEAVDRQMTKFANQNELINVVE